MDVRFADDLALQLWEIQESWGIYTYKCRIYVHILIFFKLNPHFYWLNDVKCLFWVEESHTFPIISPCFTLKTSHIGHKELDITPPTFRPKTRKKR